MKVGKPVSKRVSVRLRHKIQKASAAKQRKARKEEKKNPQWRSRLKKDPGIPNLFPYKAKVLAEIEESKRRKEEDLQRKREIAKGQRSGGAVQETSALAEDDDEELLDHDDDDESENDGMEVQDESNPMAALLASAQARATTYDQDEDDEDDEEGAEDEAEWGGIKDKPTTKTRQPERKPLPKLALEDPIKAVTKLMEWMQNTSDGVQRLLDHYSIPPLVTGSTDYTTRYLVEVARKCGRLGRGGIPNLHAAALIVLNDVNESRLQLPVTSVKKTTTMAVSAGSKSQVQIVSTLAEPFKLEGLWGDDDAEQGDEEMAA